MKKKLVIFDMDGLLLDSERITDLSWQQTFKENNIDFSEEERHQLIGMGFDEAQGFFARRFNNERAFWELRKYRENIFFNHLKTHGIDVKAGILDLIQLLKENQVKVAVASSTLQERGEFLLKTTNIHQLFDFHIYGDMVKETKPNPEIFLRVVEHFNYQKEEALVLEDSYYGVKAANNAAIDVFWVKDLVDIDTKGKVDYLDKFDSMSEALPTIKTMI